MTLYDTKQLYEALKELAIIESKQLDDSLETAEAQGIPLHEELLKRDLISDTNIGQTIADIIAVPYVHLANIQIPDDVLNIVPEVVANKQKIVAFQRDSDGVAIATSDPTNLEMIEFLKKKTGQPIQVYYATENDVFNVLAQYLKDAKQTFQDIILEEAEHAKGMTKPDVPIIKIVDTIILYAYKNKSSDIHIEPTEQFSLVRFRIDGILHDIVKMPVEIHPQITTRIKVMAELRTDERKAAQDGKIQFHTEEEELDIRVSLAPVTRGEKIVMRLLSEKSRQFSLTDLGFSSYNLKKVTRAYEKPHGMILATGPTGSGKTTSMYAILKLLNKRDVNIMTIEDPVEYDMEGVNQIQVHARTNLTFASGLRSIVRQDPDIILVGEIRDEETANIAVNAAMTGHLVLSTLHTNDAATTIPRLYDMNIEPFLIASSLNVIIAQRLIRKISLDSRVSKEIKIDYSAKKPLQTELSLLPDDLVIKHFGKKGTVRIYTGKEDNAKQGLETGYYGRSGIFEVLEIDDDIRQAIVDRKDASVIRDIAIKNGMITMIEDGVMKIKDGTTTIDEVLRVTKE